MLKSNKPRKLPSRRMQIEVLDDRRMLAVVFLDFGVKPEVVYTTFKDRLLAAQATAQVPGNARFEDGDIQLIADGVQAVLERAFVGWNITFVQTVENPVTYTGPKISFYETHGTKLYSPNSEDLPDVFNERTGTYEVDEVTYNYDVASVYVANLDAYQTANNAVQRRSDMIAAIGTFAVRGYGSNLGLSPQSAYFYPGVDPDDSGGRQTIDWMADPNTGQSVPSVVNHWKTFSPMGQAILSFADDVGSREPTYVVGNNVADSSDWINQAYYIDFFGTERAFGFESMTGNDPLEYSVFRFSAPAGMHLSVAVMSEGDNALDFYEDSIDSAIRLYHGWDDLLERPIEIGAAETHVLEYDGNDFLGEAERGNDPWLLNFELVESDDYWIVVVADQAAFASFKMIAMLQGSYIDENNTLRIDGAPGMFKDDVIVTEAEGTIYVYQNGRVQDFSDALVDDFTLDLRGGNDNGDFDTNIEKPALFYGGIGNDTFYGTQGADEIYLDDGCDLAYGREGNDSIFGGAGDDVIYGGAGIDDLDGETGHDIEDGTPDNEATETCAAIGVSDVIMRKFRSDGTTMSVEFEDPSLCCGRVDVQLWAVFGGLIEPQLLMTESNAIAIPMEDEGEFVSYFTPNFSDVWGDYKLLAIVLPAGGGYELTPEDNELYFEGGLFLSGTTFHMQGSDAADSVTITESGSGFVVAYTGTVGSGTYEYELSDITTIRVRGHGGSDVLTTSAVDEVMVGWGGAGIDDFLGGSAADTFYGGDGNDILDGATNGDSLYGEAGDDSLIGGTGTDHLYGGDDEDTLTGGNDGDYLYGDAGDDTLYGDAGVDKLYGGDDNDKLYGGADDDTLNGENGADTLYGGDGIDHLYGGDGGDNLYAEADGGPMYGGAGNDTLTGGPGNDSAYGEGGNDSLYGGDNYDTLYGGDDDDTINGGTSFDLIYGGNGNDSLLGDEDNDTLLGEAGNDYLYGGAGVDSLNGGDDNDTLYGAAGNDTLYGGNHADTLYGGDDNDFIDGQAGNDLIYGDAGTDYVYGSAGNDVVYGGDDADTLFGNDDADTMYGDGGADLVYGGAANDTILGGTGNDSLIGDDGNDSLAGETGADYVYGAGGNDSVVGGDDNDTLHGGYDDDVIFGNGGADIIYGWSGVDDISGGDGNDTIRGEDGADTLSGDAGTDIVYGGYGNDTINGGDDLDSLYGDQDDDVISGGGGANTMYGGYGNDIIYGGSANDFVYGDDGNDILYGAGGSDQLYGGYGNDNIYGGDGDDFLYGLAGQDTINGEAGNDRLDGGDNTDWLSGGDDNDVIYGGNDDSTGTPVFSGDQMFGGGGNDLMYGDGGDDYMEGNDGDDSMFGGNGDDLLSGGSGDDVLVGNAGTDSLNGGGQTGDSLTQ